MGLIILLHRIIKNVKRFERSNRLDTALYKNIPFFYLFDSQSLLPVLYVTTKRDTLCFLKKDSDYCA